MKEINVIIAELVLIGEKYPKQKSGYCGIFGRHDHQDLAQRLMKLGAENARPTSWPDLANQISEIFNKKEFKYASSLLRSVVDCLYKSEAFSEYNQFIDEMSKAIDESNSYDDGGGRAGWSVRHDVAAIRKLSGDQSIELVLKH